MAAVQEHKHGSNSNPRTDWPTSGTSPTQVPASAEGDLSKETTAMLGGAKRGRESLPRALADRNSSASSDSARFVAGR
jgi:hypothetical protein